MSASVPQPVFGTVCTAMVTAFTDDGALDVPGTVAVAKYLVDHGHDGVVIHGTTGESPTTTDAEKLETLEAVVAAVGDAAVVTCGVGSNDTAHTVAFAKQAVQAGARGVLVVTPYYSKPPQAGIAAHFRAVRDAIGDTPILAYDIPGRAGVPIEPQTLIELAKDGTIQGVKDAKDDLFSTAEVMAAVPLAYYCGSDELNLAHLTQGAVGVVSVPGHLIGNELRTLVDAVAADDLATARTTHLRTLPVIRAFMKQTQGAIMAKAAMQLAGVLNNRRTRLPLVQATEEQISVLKRSLDQAGIAL